MDQLGGGSTRLRPHRSPPSAERFLGIIQPQSSSDTPPLELSEHDIFTTLSGSSSPSPTHPYLSPNPSPRRNNKRNDYGILAALNDNSGASSGSGSGSGNRPVFNHKVSASASISSSSSISPATSISSRIMIPRPPPPPQAESVRLRHQSAPVNVPVIPSSLRRRAIELDDILSEGEEEERNGVILPPHEVVAARHSPMLACSVMEGTGRTLKGRDLRQVRNAIWRKTGFID